MIASCLAPWAAEVIAHGLDTCQAASCLLHGSLTLVHAAAWQNPPAEVAAVFARVLQKDRWGLQQEVVACLSTGNQGMEKSPYLKQKSNYQYFAEALNPDTAPIADDGKDAKNEKAEAAISALQAM